MAYNANSPTPLFAEGGSGTPRLLFYLLVATVLMVADHRGGYLRQVRDWVGLVNEPLYYVAGLPAQLARSVEDGFSTRGQLASERDELQQELLVARAQLARLQSVQQENLRLRDLLGGTRGLSLSVRLVRITDIDVDPFRHRVQLELGAHDGVEPGMAIIDGGGVFGQVIAAAPLRSTAMLVSDSSHAVPVQVQRSGLRTIAYGTGRIDRLHIPNIPLSADIQVGDMLLTSGMGGRFPAGLPVAKVTSLRPDDTRLFVEADAEPTADLGRSGDVLLVWNDPAQAARAVEMGPPESLRTPQPAVPAEPVP